MTKASESVKNWKKAHPELVRQYACQYYRAHKSRLVAQRDISKVSPTLRERFESQLEHRDDGCIQWTGTTTNAGYGVISVATGVSRGPHQVAWFLVHGEWPKLVRHTCDNRLCCNVNHLLIGTHQDNANDAVARGRQAKGVRHGMHKLTSEQVAEMRQLRAEGWTLSRLGKKFGVTESTASKVCTYRTRVEE